VDKRDAAVERPPRRTAPLSSIASARSTHSIPGGGGLLVTSAAKNAVVPTEKSAEGCPCAGIGWTSRIGDAKMGMPVGPGDESANSKEHTQMKKTFGLLILCALALVAVLPLCAQTTWGGLRFGMTPAEARVVLKERSIKDRLQPATRVGNTDLPEMLFIDVDGVTVGVHQGKASLRFDKDRLVQVSIFFARSEPQGSACFQGITTAEAASRSVMVLDLSERMLDRFGQPSVETGTFPTRQELLTFFARGSLTGLADTESGKRIWRTEGQVIEENISLPCGSTFVTIIYRPQKGDDL